MKKTIKPKIVAVICFDLDDFREWKKLSGHSNAFHEITFYMTGTYRKYQFDNTIYYYIHRVIDLCSLAIDEIVSTIHAHKNPEYKEIMNAAQANLNKTIILPIEKKSEISINKSYTIEDLKKAWKTL
jgi:hypothetical protein